LVAKRFGMQNETFGMQSQNWTMSKEAFCLYPHQFSSDFPKQIFLVLHKPCEYQNGQKVDLEINGKKIPPKIPANINMLPFCV